MSPRLWSPAFLIVSTEDPILLRCELSAFQDFEDEFLVWWKSLAVIGYFWKLLIRALSVSGMGRSSFKGFLWLRYLISRLFPGSDQWWQVNVGVEHLRCVYKVEESVSALRRGPFDWIFGANLSQFSKQLFSCICDISSSYNKTIMSRGKCFLNDRQNKAKWP